ncbi:Calcium-binding protein CML19 [Hondaea fermentalgiana]|uniref:Calcium-binding protein CML19 n=1 Tax=Hondaea fermentalgiana TaxID=2315210 RepID=A0A2R5GYB5_9STRA|nr:Calcium-binding protein CML19 [Hondaea fermentalgiana]|eukprot:GBG33441.1 Calcium-binding protein CML19 [Hondaea fermentalgiana]
MRNEDHHVFRKLGDPAHWDIKVYWEGAQSPFASLKCLTMNPKVSQLRSTLISTGKIPSETEVTFLVPGSGPLNPLQESLCGIGVFGSARPLQINMRLQGNHASRYAQNAETQALLSNVKGEGTSLEEVSSILAKLVAQCGRKVLTVLLARVEKEASGEITFAELKAVIEGALERLQGPTTSMLREDVVRAFGRLGADQNERISYAQLVQCLPKHLQTKSERISSACQEAEQDLAHLCDKLADLHRDGLHRRIARHELIQACNASTTAHGEGPFLHPGLGVRGEVEGNGALVTFVARHVPLYAILGESDKPKAGTLSFETLAAHLRRWECVGALEKARLRSALSRFHVSGNAYDYVGLLEHAIPRTKEERSALLEDTLSRVQTELLRLSFAGARLQQLFAKLDPRSTGSINAQDFGAFLRHDLGIPLSSEQINQVLYRFDPEYKGKIVYGDFVAMLERGHDRWASIPALTRTISIALHNAFFDQETRSVNLARAFESLDTDGDGIVSASDLQRSLLRFEPSVETNVPSLHRVIECLQGGSGGMPAAGAPAPSSRTAGLGVTGLTKLLQSAPQRSIDQLREILRSAILATWRKGTHNLREIFVLLAEPAASTPSVPESEADRVMTADSLRQGAKAGLDLQLRRDEAFRMIYEGVAKPHDYTAFIDFVFPAAAPTLHDVAARIQRALKRKSLAGIAIRRFFEIFDPSGSGAISEPDFERGVMRLGLGLSRADVSKLLASGLIRQDLHSRRISYDEFVRFALQSASSQVRDAPSQGVLPPHVESQSAMSKQSLVPLPTATTAVHNTIDPATTSAQVKRYYLASRPF